VLKSVNTRKVEKRRQSVFVRFLCEKSLEIFSCIFDLRRVDVACPLIISSTWRLWWRFATVVVLGLRHNIYFWAVSRSFRCCVRPLNESRRF